MSLYKPSYVDRKTGQTLKSAVWWFEFVFRGRRFRQSAGSREWVEASKAEKAYRTRLEMVAAGMPLDKASSGWRVLREFNEQKRAEDAACMEAKRVAVKALELDSRQRGAISGSIRRQSERLAKQYQFEKGSKKWLTKARKSLKMARKITRDALKLQSEKSAQGSNLRLL